MTSRLEEIWEPRIGSDAAAALHHSAYVRLVITPITFALAVGSSFAFGSGTIGVTLGVIAWVVIVALFATWIRSMARLAAALSGWFETRINWWEMPNFRSTAGFDAWCRKRGIALYMNRR